MSHLTPPLLASPRKEGRNVSESLRRRLDP
jgi:hypothetical protein